MAATFELEIATPERLMVRESVTDAQIPAKGGMLGILPEHAPLLSLLGCGVLSYHAEGRLIAMAISGGWLEVLPDHVRVLTDTAERANEIDVPRAQRALERAKQRLVDPAIGIDIARALSAALRAETRLKAAGQQPGS